MLSCIFGKCSSETYIVTNPKSPIVEVPYDSRYTNGNDKINSISEFPHSTESNNHQNNKQNNIVSRQKETFRIEPAETKPTSHPLIASGPEVLDKQEGIKEKPGTVEVRESIENIYVQSPTISANNKHQAPTPPRKKIAPIENKTEQGSANGENIAANDHLREPTDTVKEGVLYEASESVTEINTDKETSRNNPSHQVKVLDNSTHETLHSREQTIEQIWESAEEIAETKERPKKYVDTAQREAKASTVNSEYKAENDGKEQHRSAIHEEKSELPVAEVKVKIEGSSKEPSEKLKLKIFENPTGVTANSREETIKEVWETAEEIAETKERPNKYVDTAQTEAKESTVNSEYKAADDGKEQHRSAMHEEKSELPIAEVTVKTGATSSQEPSDKLKIKIIENPTGATVNSREETIKDVWETAEEIAETKGRPNKYDDTVQKEMKNDTVNSKSIAENDEAEQNHSAIYEETTQEATLTSKNESIEDIREKVEEITENKQRPNKYVDLVQTEPKNDTVNSESRTISEENVELDRAQTKRRSGVIPLSTKYDENASDPLPKYLKAPDDEALIKTAIESNEFLNKIISGKRLEDVINSMYNKEIATKETIVKQGEKGTHMYISAKGKYQVVVKGKVVSEFSDVRVFGELAILYNSKRLATIKALTPGRVWVLDRSVYQQIMLRYNIKEQDEIMEFLMNNKKLNVVGKDALQEVANLLKSEFFLPGKQIVRQGDKGHQFYIIRAGTVTITKDGEGVVGHLKKGECFGELALLKEDCRQATVTANAPGVECLTLTRKEFIDHFGEVENLTDIKVRPKDSIKDAIAEHEDINLNDLKIIKTLGVGGFGRVELVQHKKKKNLVFALKYLKKIDIVLQHQEEHVYNEKNIQMASKSPFIVRLYRTYKDSKYIYLLMESCLGGDLWSLLQKQKLRRFEEKEARFIAACVLESFEYLHSRGIIYRDLKPENLLISTNGYIKLTDFGFAKKLSSRGRTFTFAGTPEYVAPEIVLNRGHDRAVDYWAFGAFIFELLTGRTPFRTDDSSHMKTYNKILNGIDNIQFPSYVNLKARHIIEKLCRPVPSERLGMQRGGIKDIKTHKWFLGFDFKKFANCEIPSPFKPKLKNQVDTQYFDQFKKDTDLPPDEISGWDVKF